MKKVTQILIFAFIGVVIVNIAKAQTYDPLAVQRINDLIANNGLQATPDAPETWDFAAWNDETPKQIMELYFGFVLPYKIGGDASFAGLTTLWKLTLDGNSLTKLDVSGCTDLRFLQCCYNNLTELNLTGCTKLEYLDCVDNHFTKLDVTPCVSLNSLFIGYNFLTELDITKCTQLNSISYNDNYFTKLDLTSCKQLNSVFCENNRLTELNVKNCEQMEGLYCSKNNLTELDVTGTRLSSLEAFDQQVSLTLYENGFGEYTHSILLNNPTFGNSAISYWEAMLKSNDSSVNSTGFTVQTIGGNYQLRGTMYFDYSNVGIQTQENEQLKVYPNPTTGELHITGNRHCGLDPQSPENYEIAGQARNDIKNIEIFDVMGKSVYVETHCSAPLQQPTTIFDISNLPAGIYFVKIITDTGVVVKKVVKQ